MTRPARHVPTSIAVVMLLWACPASADLLDEGRDFLTDEAYCSALVWLEAAGEVGQAGPDGYEAQNDVERAFLGCRSMAGAEPRAMERVLTRAFADAERASGDDLRLPRTQGLLADIRAERHRRSGERAARDTASAVGSRSNLLCVSLRTRQGAQDRAAQVRTSTGEVAAMHSARVLALLVERDSIAKCVGIDKDSEGPGALSYALFGASAVIGAAALTYNFVLGDELEEFEAIRADCVSGPDCDRQRSQQLQETLDNGKVAILVLTSVAVVTGVIGLILTITDSGPAPESMMVAPSITRDGFGLYFGCSY